MFASERLHRTRRFVANDFRYRTTAAGLLNDFLAGSQIAHHIRLALIEWFAFAHVRRAIEVVDDHLVELILGTARQRRFGAGEQVVAWQVWHTHVRRTAFAGRLIDNLLESHLAHGCLFGALLLHAVRFAIQTARAFAAFVRIPNVAGKVTLVIARRALFGRHAFAIFENFAVATEAPFDRLRALVAQRVARLLASARSILHFDRTLWSIGALVALPIAADTIPRAFPCIRCQMGANGIRDGARFAEIRLTHRHIHRRIDNQMADSKSFRIENSLTRIECWWQRITGRLLFDGIAMLRPAKTRFVRLPRLQNVIQTLALHLLRVLWIRFQVVVSTAVAIAAQTFQLRRILDAGQANRKR